MIRNFERYHGIVLVRLIRSFPSGLHVRPYSKPGGASGASYVLENKLGLYIKYSSHRMSPWGFSFKPDHLNEIAELAEQLEDVLLLLVCGHDGLVALEFSGEFKTIIGDTKSTTPVSKWIRASRDRKGLYKISGSLGDLPYKVSRAALIEKVLSKLATPSRRAPPVHEE